MRAFLAALLIAAGVLGYHAVGTHHMFAPALPYGPCPVGSHYSTFWEHGTKTPIQAGVLHYHGWTEIASCAGSITVSGG